MALARRFVLALLALLAKRLHTQHLTMRLARLRRLGIEVEGTGLSLIHI